MDEQLKTIKPNSPRWMDCDLNCEDCTDAPDCPFKRRHDEANLKVSLKTKKEKKQKNKKRKAAAAAVNARARKSVQCAAVSQRPPHSSP